MKVLLGTTYGEGVLFDESGRVWDDTEKAWEAAPSGTDAWPSENVIPGVQIESINVKSFEIPEEASGANWSLVLYAGTGNNKNGAVYAIVTKPNYSNEAPISQTPTPLSRTYKLRRTGNGLVSSDGKKVGIQVGEEKLIAVDFTNDLPSNGRIESAGTPTIKEGTAAGVTFGTPSRDRGLAKVKITGGTAGNYTINFPVTYADGGGRAEADLLLTVVA